MFWKKMLFLGMVFNIMGFMLVDISTDHAIYISVSKITHEEAQPTATIQMRVFADDLKSVLRNKFGYEAISEKETFCSDYEHYINRYFKKKLTFTINKEITTIKLINCERTDEVYQLMFIMDCPINWDSAQISATYFMELFPKQSNVFHIEDADIKQFGRATKGDELLKMRF